MWTFNFFPLNNILLTPNTYPINLGSATGVTYCIVTRHHSSASNSVVLWANNSTVHSESNSIIRDKGMEGKKKLNRRVVTRAAPQGGDNPEHRIGISQQHRQGISQQHRQEITQPKATQHAIPPHKPHSIHKPPLPFPKVKATRHQGSKEEEQVQETKPHKRSSQTLHTLYHHPSPTALPNPRPHQEGRKEA